jgi:hypothetical protein
MSLIIIIYSRHKITKQHGFVETEEIRVIGKEKTRLAS